MVTISTATPTLAASASSRITGMVDRREHREADHVGHQRREARHEEAPERVARGHEALGAATDVLHDAVHLLGAMGDADGEHQERHEDRIRVEVEAQERHDPELPGHRHERAADHEGGAARAARVGEQDQRRDEGGDREERHHAREPSIRSPTTFAKPTMRTLTPAWRGESTA